MTAILDKLLLARARIADPKDWRGGTHPHPDGPCEAPPYCAGSALWDPHGGEDDRAAEAEAIRLLLAAAGVAVEADEDAETDALVAWNDSSDHATVLAAFDRAIAGCGR